MLRVLPAHSEMYRASDMSQDRGIIPLPLSPSPSWCVVSWLNTYQTGTLFPARYNGAQDPSGGRARGRVHERLCPRAAGPGSFTLANLLLLTFSPLAHSEFSFLDYTSFSPSINPWQFSLLARCCLLQVLLLPTLHYLTWCCLVQSYLYLFSLPCPPEGAAPLRTAPERDVDSPRGSYFDIHR